MTLGSAIKLIRTANGVKQRDLAKKVNATPNYLSLIEAGKREPSISFLKMLAKELEVPISMFFLWQEPPSSIPLQDRQLRELRDLIVHLQAISVSGQKKDRHDKRRR
jgi:transcriptional regulator with XRE-family HTH domain